MEKLRNRRAVGKKGEAAMKILLLCAFVLAVAWSTFGFEYREEPACDDWDDNCELREGTLSYYYFINFWWRIPGWGDYYCWASHFWAVSGWEQGDIIGCWFQPGDLGTLGFDPVDPEDCNHIEQIRVLDFSAAGTVYPGLFTVEFDIWASDSGGCPIGPSLWSSGPVETKRGYNCIEIEPPLCMGALPRVLITAEHIGPQFPGYGYPAWGFDNISGPILEGVELHDDGCLQALYPRPHLSHYQTMHSGYYGQNFAYCPPQWFRDCRDSTPDGSEYGYVELAWSIFMQCLGPSKAEPVTWGAIKAMYR
jgi:hypothetical protein